MVVLVSTVMSVLFLFSNNEFVLNCNCNNPVDLTEETSNEIDSKAEERFALPFKNCS